ncbi:ECF transporter S component, partial [Anaerotignum sp.]
MNSTYSIKDLTKTGMMAALTFIGIYAVKIPSLHGYSHMGDCMIFLGVLILGTKKGAL